MYFGSSGLSLGDTFKVTSSGDLTATSGSIANWALSSNVLESSTSTKKTLLDAGNQQFSFQKKYGTVFKTVSLFSVDDSFDLTSTNVSTQSGPSFYGIPFGTSYTSTEQTQSANISINSNTSYTLSVVFTTFTAQSPAPNYVDMRLKIEYYDNSTSTWVVYAGGSHTVRYATNVDSDAIILNDISLDEFNTTYDSITLFEFPSNSDITQIRVGIIALGGSNISPSDTTSVSPVFTINEYVPTTQINSEGFIVGSNPDNYFKAGLSSAILHKKPLHIFESKLTLTGGSIDLRSSTIGLDTDFPVFGNIKMFDDLEVVGDFSVSGTKSFKINHPNPDKAYKYDLYHSAVESPTAGDTLYTYECIAKEDGETVEIPLESYWPFLNKDPKVFIQSRADFAGAK